MGIQENIRKLVHGGHPDPFSVLGMHAVGPTGKRQLEVRAFLPEAREAWIIDERDGSRCRMVNTHRYDFFTASVASTSVFPYRIGLVRHDGTELEFRDPYSFPPVLTDYDLHLIGEGTHYRQYEKLGAHVVRVNDADGVHFAVWAPNASNVSVSGSFNGWDRRRHPMRLLGASGIWELFIPGIGEGELYKFYVRSRFHGYEAEKADPYAFCFEKRPKSASVVCDIAGYRWSDHAWMETRPKKNWFASPLSVYEVHLGSWMRVPEEENRFLTYRELADTLIPYARDMGYTHLELLPVAEHPLDASWGYQTIGYFAPTSRFGSPKDFMFFVDQCHLNGLGVILDWAPAHFPKDGHGLGFFDGTSLYEHEDPRQGEHRDWGTLNFNYGRNEVRNFLISNALFWFENYHVDGLRVDAVASMLYRDYSRNEGEWIPNQFGGRENLEAISFIKQFNEVTHAIFPGILTIAEESTAWPGVTRPVYLGGLGFDMKWNMGWMNDMLEYMAKDPIHRKYHQNSLTFGLLYAFTENFMLVLSHDEVVHEKQSLIGKMPGDQWQKFANLRLFYGFMYGHPGKKLLFMGSEIGQRAEWNFDQSLDWHLLNLRPHARLQRFLQDLNRLYTAEPALYEVDYAWPGFEWIDFRDADTCTLSFIRRADNPEDHIVVACNFTPVPRHDYRIGVPENCFYREILNSDSAAYAGSNLGNQGGVMTEPIPWHGQPCSMTITIPPLAVVYFKPQS